MGYFQEDYTAFLVDRIKGLWNQDYASAQVIKIAVQSKKHKKIFDTGNWIKDTIPSGIISRYWISEYLMNAQKPDASKNQLDYKIINKEIAEHYDFVYEKMPMWWKKIGSLIRNVKKWNQFH